MFDSLQIGDDACELRNRGLVAWDLKNLATLFAWDFLPRNP